jgi:hypothetical protein
VTLGSRAPFHRSHRRLFRACIPRSDSRSCPSCRTNRLDSARRRIFRFRWRLVGPHAAQPGWRPDRADRLLNRTQPSGKKVVFFNLFVLCMLSIKERY